jgi:predicted nucleotidyltransferase
MVSWGAMQRLDPRSPDVQARLARAIELLARDSRVRLVYLFGSAADPGDPGSRDIDLAVSAAPPFTPDELARRRADLVADTHLPLDLVSLDGAPVVLAYEVAETGRCVHARDPDAEVEFVTQARARYWDFKPYRDEQWRLAAERLAERGGS